MCGRTPYAHIAHLSRAFGFGCCSKTLCRSLTTRYVPVRIRVRVRVRVRVTVRVRVRVRVGLP